MSLTILDDIPFELDLPALLGRLHIEAGSADAATVESMAEQARQIARAKAMYRLAYVQEFGDAHVVIDGVRLDSRVLRVNLDGRHRVWAYVATCGRELEEWSASRTDMLESYWASAIKEQALGCAMRFLGEHITAAFQPGQTAQMNPGSLSDWPLAQQRRLFEIVGDARGAIGVELTDSCLMVPTKSVSGLRFPTEVKFENCQLCPRPECPGRRAEYDSKLFAQRFAPK